MSRNISARLQTLCGCTQIRLVPAPAPEIIEVPIAVFGDDDSVRFHNRRFRLIRISPPEIAVDAEYCEVKDA